MKCKVICTVSVVVSAIIALGLWLIKLLKYQTNLRRLLYTIHRRCYEKLSNKDYESVFDFELEEAIVLSEKVGFRFEEENEEENDEE